MYTYIHINMYRSYGDRELCIIYVYVRTCMSVLLHAGAMEIENCILYMCMYVYVYVYVYVCD